MTEKRKNIKFLLCQIVVTVLGLVTIVIKGNAVLLWAYVPVMVIAISTTYFNYSLCRWGNRWHAILYERNPCSGEPSNLRLYLAKVSEWSLFLLALMLVFIPGRM